MSECNNESSEEPLGLFAPKSGAKFYDDGHEVDLCTDGPWLARKLDGEWLVNGTVRVKACDVVEWWEAVGYYTSLIEDEPTNAWAYLWRSRVRLFGEPDTAIKDLTTAIELAPDIQVAKLERGYKQYFSDNYSAAIVDFTDVLRDDPNPPAEVYKYRGLAYLSLGESLRALADFNESHRRDPLINAAAGICSAALQWQIKKEYGKAMELCNFLIDNQKELGDNTSMSGAYCTRGDCWSARGDDSAALADYNSAIALDPSSWTALKRRARYYGGTVQGKIDSIKAQRLSGLPPNDEPWQGL